MADSAAGDLERLERKLSGRVGKAIGDFGLIEPGDRILVGVSGGKDSWALLHLLRRLARRAPVRFDLVPLNVDQGFAGFRADIVEDYLAREGYAYEMRSLLGALSRVDLASLPIPSRPEGRSGALLPMVEAALKDRELTGG